MLEKYEDTLIRFDKALARNPKRVNSLSNKVDIKSFKLLGECLRLLKRSDDSFECFD